VEFLVELDITSTGCVALRYVLLSASCCVVLHCIALCCVALCCVALHCVVLCCVAL